MGAFQRNVTEKGTQSRLGWLTEGKKGGGSSLEMTTGSKGEGNEESPAELQGGTGSYKALPQKKRGGAQRYRLRESVEGFKLSRVV